MEAFVPPAALPCRARARPHAHPRLPGARPPRPARSPRCVDTTPARPARPTPPAPPPFSAGSSALLEGIRAVAVGKHGSRPVAPALLAPLQQELYRAAQAPLTPPYLDLHLLRASFLGSLYVKAAHTPAEAALLELVTASERPAPADLLAVVDPRRAAPPALRAFAAELLAGARLPRADAAALGRLLYAVEPPGAVAPRAVKAVVAHVMRVRHETAAELLGLAEAARASVPPSWFRGARARAPFAHVAEPFDGAVTHDLLTPLLCARLQARGLRPVMAVGPSSGPKYGPNLRDVARALAVPFCRAASDVAEQAGPFGVAVDQEDVSPGLSAWVHMRRVILKRPGIATVEKYVDACPGGARLFIGSAFHGNYVGKMADMAEGLAYEAYVIVGKGVEGTTGLGVSARRTATLLTGWRRGDGRFAREEVEFNVLSDGDGASGVSEETEEPERGCANASVTAERIGRFAETGRSGDAFFDKRARATLQAFDKALDVLERNGVSFA